MTYNFHPFVEPTNAGVIELPNFNTLMEKRETEIQIVKQKTEESTTKWPEDLNLDFDKLEKSKGRQIKGGGGYTHAELTAFGKKLKRSGFNIDTKSKNSIIDSISVLKKNVNL